jgi:hypothetical protein
VLGAGIFFLLPSITNAYSVDYETAPITLSDGSTAPVTRETTPSRGGTEATFGIGYDAPGTTYTGIFTISGTETEVAKAPMLIVSGGLIQSYSYNATTHQATIVWTGDQFIIPDNGQLVNESAFVFIAPGTDPTPENPNVQGCPASMAGGYVSTNITDWQINPPTSREQMGFGLSLNGPANLVAYYTMYMPSTMLNLMSTMSGRTVTPTDLALFIDNYQSSLKKTITADNGVIFDISLTFKSGDTNVSSTSTVSKTVMAQEREKLSAAFKDNKVKKNKTAKLYGWMKNAKKGKAINIYYKKKGASTFTFLKQVKTIKNNGYYIYKFAPTEKGQFYYKAKSVNNKKKSSKVKLTVK